MIWNKNMGIWSNGEYKFILTNFPVIEIYFSIDENNEVIYNKSVAIDITSRNSYLRKIITNNEIKMSVGW